MATAVGAGKKRFRLNNETFLFRIIPMPDVPNLGYPRRPPRLEWIFSDIHSFYFVTFNTYERLPLLAKTE